MPIEETTHLPQAGFKTLFDLNDRIDEMHGKDMEIDQFMKSAQETAINSLDASSS